MNYYFNVAVANGINKLGWTPDVPDEHLGYKFSPTCHEVITICEEIEKLVEGWPVVYSSNSGIIGGERNYSAFKMPDSDQSARLAFIEKIKKECVKHEPDFKSFEFDVEGNRVQSIDWGWVKCRHCGVPLQATWSEKK